MSFCAPDDVVGAGSVGRGALPMILKNAVTNLFQKTSKTPIMLAMPEVTVITWSGPAYSANNSKCMKAPSLTTLKERYSNFTGVLVRTETKISVEPAVTLVNSGGSGYCTVIKRVPV